MQNIAILSNTIKNTKAGKCNNSKNNYLSACTSQSGNGRLIELVIIKMAVDIWQWNNGVAMWS